ncbi:MAG: hypothetical protein AAF620_08720 [Bacteroidota bacterium]
MSTRKLSDKELDQYFKNILKKPEAVPFDEAVWRSMNQKLTRPSARKGFLNWVIGSSIVLIGLLIYLFITSFINDSDHIQSAFGQTSEALADTTSSEEQFQNHTNLYNRWNREKEISKSTNSDHNYLKDTSKKIEIEQKLSFKKAVDARRKKINEEIIISDTHNQDTNTIKSSALTSKSTKENSFTFFQNKQSIEEKAQDIFKSVLFNVADDLDHSESTPVINPRICFTLQEADLDFPNDLALVSISTPPFDSSELTTKSRRFIDRFSVGISLAPDLSTVEELNEFDRVGLDGGIHLEYFIKDRLSITGGALYTQKIYRTSDLSEYQLPDTFWSNGIEPERINANCDVIDIPINLRYQLIQGLRTSAFISAGLSSYIMVTELYEYNYSEPNDLINQWYSEFTNKNQHYFGVYNFSFGVSHRIAKNISIEVEPYLKNSFGRVGWGQVQLKSTGALFHFKYSFRTQ